MTWSLASGVPSRAEYAGHPSDRFRATGDEDRKILVIVEAGISDAAAVEVKRMIEQRAVAVGRGLHLLKEAENSETWKVSIFAILANFSGSPPWWLVG